MIAFVANDLQVFVQSRNTVNRFTTKKSLYTRNLLEIIEHLSAYRRMYEKKDYDYS